MNNKNSSSLKKDFHFVTDIILVCFTLMKSVLIHTNLYQCLYLKLYDNEEGIHINGFC